MNNTTKRALAGALALGGIGWAGYAVYEFFAPERPIDYRNESIASKAAKPSPEVFANAEADDRSLMDALAKQQRWVKLPIRSDRVATTADGSTYFRHQLGNLELFKHSFARYARGEGRTIRGNGTLLIVDSAGRHWGVAPGPQRDIFGHDGKDWLSSRPLPTKNTTIASIPASQPSTRRMTRQPDMRFLRTALEVPATGDVYFATTADAAGDDRPAGLHRVSRDGTWSFIPYPDNVAVDGESTLMHMTGERVAVVPHASGGPAIQSLIRHLASANGHGTLPPVDPPVVLVWDGTAWATLRSNQRPGRTVHRVIALPDGSVLTYFEQNVIELDWPTGSPAADAATRAIARALIEQLNVDDAATQTDALARLLRLGPIAAAEVDAALADEEAYAPQARLHLSVARARYKKMLTTPTDGEATSTAPLLGGRYKVYWAFPLSRRHDGQTRFYAEKCLDTIENREIGACIITVLPSGEWNATPAGAGHLFHYEDTAYQDRYVDTGERLYVLDQSFTVGQQVTFQSNKPFGINLSEVLASDEVRGGRLFYAAQDEMYVCNLAIPDVSDGHQLAYLDATSELYRGTSGARNAWASRTDLHELREDGTTRKVQLLGDANTTLDSIWPLDGRAAMIWLRPRIMPYGQISDCYLYLDGLWLGPFKYSRALIHAQAIAFARHAPRDFVHQYSTGRRLTLRIGSDRGRGLWYLGATSEQISNRSGTLHAMQKRSIFEYFDGQSWHNAWAPFAQDFATALAEQLGEADHIATNPDGLPRVTPIESDLFSPIGSVDDGRSVLVYDGLKGCLWSVKFDAGRMVRTSIDGADDIRSEPMLVDTNGRAGWLAVPLGNRSYKTLRYLDGKFVPVDVAGQGFATDRTGRLWLRDETTLRVIDAAGNTAAVSLPGLDRTTRLLESSDRQMWAVTGQGVSNVALSPDGTTLNVQPAMTWTVPVNALTDPNEPMWADASGGIWMRGADNRVGRLTPLSKLPTTALTTPAP